MANVTCASMQSNSDVSGIGIRINLYTTTLLLALVPKIPGLTTPLIEVLSANAGISGASLIITAIIQTAKGQLTLYHAIFIIHMLFFLGVIMSPSGRYAPTALLPRLFLTTVLTYGIMLLYTGWALYVWSTAQTFGGLSSECNNHVRYIFFFRSVRATVTWLRALWIVGLGMGAAALVVIPLVLAGCACVRWRRGQGGWGGTEEVAHINWGLPLAAIYDIVMLELYVKRNRSLFPPSELSQETGWSFGQILALVMIMSTLNELLHFGLSLCWMPRSVLDELDSDGEEGGRRDGDLHGYGGSPSTLRDEESGEARRKVRGEREKWRRVRLLPSWMSRKSEEESVVEQVDEKVDVVRQHGEK